MHEDPSLKALPHACSTYSLGFIFTFAGAAPPISSSGSLVLPLSQSRGKKSQHNPRGSLSYSLSLSHNSLIFFLCLSLSAPPHWSMQISAMHLAFNSTWMRKSLKSQKDVQHVKMNYSSPVIIRVSQEKKHTQEGPAKFQLWELCSI